MKSLKEKRVQGGAKRDFVRALGVVGLLVLAGCAGTPEFRDEQGDVVEGSIASLERLQIRGRDQGVVIRGRDAQAPVLLWLAGGPGGSEIGWVRTYLGELEEHFVVVHWDQPGVGMSYGAADYVEISVQDYVDDLIDLSAQLKQRFGRKVYVAGHSYGSVLGLLASSQRPDLFAAYFAVAQHVNSLENDLIGYQYLMGRAQSLGKTEIVKRLEDQGPPPYSEQNGDNYIYLFQKLHVYSPRNADTGGEPDFWSMVFPDEYNLVDSINLIRGLLKAVPQVYPRLVPYDMEEMVPELEIPVFFFHGGLDMTCVQDIAYRYFEGLEAPHKEFIWYEDAGHNICYQEPQRFVRDLVERVQWVGQHL
ncbi:alpha/beta fold hydrolase [Spirochaeta lutea]|uniref:AB hydrolase-1 domain-containing protein n=1 Tax=Spirochaeta lutea TaxID=1480694 RepID=A0A098QWR4_9SPIO|nr:alpha/beta hydrolase [Spirochaeta lutea]KGE70927.1 hypothetical protein DC28_13365 [Spirochaeta lutea]